jgi:hypothetical protein
MFIHFYSNLNYIFDSNWEDDEFVTPYDFVSAGNVPVLLGARNSGILTFVQTIGE